MGKFIYEGGVRNEFEDRLLAHLQVVIGNKLRRGEPFYFVWKDDIST
ncbi:ATP-dependent DNA ligase, partial [Microbacterium testaceum]